MPPFRSIAAAVVLVVGLVASTGCANRESPALTASADKSGLALEARIRATDGSLFVETTIRNTRAVDAHLDTDQCGRVAQVILARTVFEPEGANYTRSLDALKRLVLRQQRSNQFSDRFAPRRVRGGSDPPECVRPTRPFTIAPGQSIAEHWELPFSTAYGLAAVGSEHETVRVQAVESVAADKLAFLDILPEEDAQAARAGRAVTVESPASAVLDRPATRPNTDPSLGQEFDRMVETSAIRTFIETQAADSWRRGTITPTGGGLEFRAVTTAYERALVAALSRDGSIIGEAVVPGLVDRARTFERRSATPPPGIAVIPEPDVPVLTEEVIAGRLALPSGRLVADGFVSGDAEPLPDVAEPGAYPVSVTVARSPGSGFDTVAFASVVVSDAPTVSWVARSTVGVDGGTAGFTSAEGSALLGRIGLDANSAVMTDAFDSLTAHDDIVTEMPIGEGSNLAMFTTGYGDGGYGMYVGLDEDGRPTRFVLDCAIVHLDWPVP